jgi:hypothetical protein
MTPCKLCLMLPNADLQNDLTNKSSRWIAENYDIGKTTVNKHRKRCDTNTIVMPSRPVDELQSFEFNGASGIFNTGAVDEDIAGMSHEAVLVMFGHDPEKVEIDKLLRESHKQYWDRDNQSMKWKHSYSFAVKKKFAETSETIVDAIELMKQVIPSITSSKPSVGQSSTFVLDWADWQFAKKEGGGSQGLIDRLLSAFDSAEKRILELRSIGRRLDELVIIGGGDMVEGCVIYPNQSYEIDDHRRGQIKNTVAMILYGIKKLAPLFNSVRVVVAPGNHGEHRIAGNRTTIGDNDDLLVFEMAQVGIESDPKYKHVSFEIADKEMSVTTNVRGWTYGVTHGDVYGRGSGTGIRNKVFAWFKTMAANRHPVGLADVLVTHHFHHDALEDWGATLWIQNPTMDGGSHYFKEATGHDTKPGMNSWVVTAEERLQDKQILR